MNELQPVPAPAPSADGGRDGVSRQAGAEPDVEVPDVVPWWRAWLPFVLVCAVIFGVRWHTVDQVVVNWDESVYWHVAQDMVNGGSLYRTAWDHKGPFLYIVLAAPIALFGNSIVALRLTGTLVVLLTMLVIELISRRLVGRRRAFVAPLFYGLLLSVPVFGGLAVRTELVMMLPVSLALLFYLVARDAQGRRRLLWFGLCGCATGVAVLVKGVAAHTLAAVPLLMLVDQIRGRRPNLRRLMTDGAAVGLGLLAVVAATVAVFWLRGTFHEFIYANLKVNLLIAGHESLQAGSQPHWVLPFVAWAVQGDPFTMVVLASVAWLLLKRRELVRQEGTVWFLAALTGLSFLGFAVSPYMFFHYYLQMALPFGLLVACAAAHLGITAKDWERVALIALIICVVTAFSPVRSPGGRHTRAAVLDDTLRKVARFVSDNTVRNDRIFVLGGEPIIHFLTERKAPTRYFWWLLSDDEFDAVLGSRKVVLADLRRTPPRLFVYKRSDPRVVELGQFMVANYVPIATIDDYQIALYKNAKQPLPAR